MGLGNFKILIQEILNIAIKTRKNPEYTSQFDDAVVAKLSGTINEVLEEVAGAIATRLANIEVN